MLHLKIVNWLEIECNPYKIVSSKKKYMSSNHKWLHGKSVMNRFRESIHFIKLVQKRFEFLYRKQNEELNYLFSNLINACILKMQ